MCFSPEGDLAGGLVVTAIGVDAWRHLRGRDTHLLLAALPLLLGAHQIIESLVWWVSRATFRTPSAGSRCGLTW